MKLCFICGQKNDDEDEFCCRCMNMLPVTTEDSDEYFIDQDEDDLDDSKDSE